MADIKQAAKWMQEGKRVRRHEFPDHVYLSAGTIWRTFRSKEASNNLLLNTSDLLADDWEIAQ